MAIRLVTPPTLEPVSLAEAKAHLRLEETRDDVYVQALITAARQHIEKVCWRGLLTQTIELELPSFRGADNLDLPQTYGAQPTDDASRFQPYLDLVGEHLADALGLEPAERLVEVNFPDGEGDHPSPSRGAFLYHGVN